MVIVSAPTSLPDPTGITVVHVETALEMRDAVTAQCEDADALIMAAAVADYRPSSESAQKIKKSNDDLTISLTKTVDILEDAKGSFVKVGFAAESQNLVENAKVKVKKKGLDLIVANDITDPQSGFGVDTNKVSLIGSDLRVEELPLLTKYEVSNRILDRVIPLFRA